MLYRLTDVSRAFEQLFTVLKDGGDLVISEPIGDSRLLQILRRSARAAGVHPFPRGRLEHLTSRAWIAAAEGAGFRCTRWFHLGYIAFPVLGFPEALAVMRHVPLPMAAARVLLGIDRVLARVPYLRTWSWQAMFQFRKPRAAADR